MSSPELFVITGCNGAGKTTASYHILLDILDCKEFINADEIAHGLSPFNPESVAIEAGRLMLRQWDALLENKITFAFEITLATRIYLRRINRDQLSGYQVKMIYLWLDSPELARERESREEFVKGVITFLQILFVEGTL